jgi:hypothetical protein
MRRSEQEFPHPTSERRFRFIYRLSSRPGLQASRLLVLETPSIWGRDAARYFGIDISQAIVTSLAR